VVRLGIVSDSHGSDFWTERFLERANREGYDGVFHLGDGEAEARWLGRRLKMPLIFVAGNCDIRFHGGIKTSHRATVGIAILRDYWSLGIGSAMFAELISAAQSRGTEIVELEFIEGNDRARRLYEKFGFRIVCQKPNAFKLKDGTRLSEFHMQKYL